MTFHFEIIFYIESLMLLLHKLTCSWVVVLPCGSRNLNKPFKLELVIYASQQVFSFFIKILVSHTQGFKMWFSRDCDFSRDMEKWL